MKTLILTGAGISASAGIPTYRDSGASWKDPDLEKKSHSSRYGNHLNELWDKHWGPVASVMHSAVPTPAHLAITEFQKRNPETIVATQNMDRLHEDAGNDNVAHLHGDMSIKCIRCKTKNLDVTWSGKGAPVCSHCGSQKTRPDVVLFGENLDAKLMKGLYFYSKSVTHLITIGASLSVFPAADLAMDLLSSGIETHFVNAEIVPMGKWFKYKHIGLADDLVGPLLESL